MGLLSGCLIYILGFGLVGWSDWIGLCVDKCLTGYIIVIAYCLVYRPLLCCY